MDVTPTESALEPALRPAEASHPTVVTSGGAGAVLAAVREFVQTILLALLCGFFGSAVARRTTWYRIFGSMGSAWSRTFITASF